MKAVAVCTYMLWKMGEGHFVHDPIYIATLMFGGVTCAPNGGMEFVQAAHVGGETFALPRKSDD